MSAAEFEACIPFLQQLSEKRIAAARAVLVDGEKPVIVALRYQWSRQAVNMCVNRLWETFENYKAAKVREFEANLIKLPEGWEVATLAAPKHVLQKLRVEVEAARTPIDGIEEQ
ncbi:hypothetical protein B0920_03225 [Massilia sp. KIM]|uniref:TrfB-related DNA-binding protein n=1 Tax=Massilia sp. KIM TaxID=1955422 RepID=UPI0009C9B476|nr:TrfB-related DNA-binding protein [Massilia sp. KIM]OON62484.1 hypothetical protein B0920_03225 [Massilia sp. KIM]